MENHDDHSLSADISALDSKLTRLIAHVEQLRTENESLLHKQNQLTIERATLLQQNEQARSKVEAIIARLKLLEDFS